MARLTCETPSWSRSHASGWVASSAAATKSSRWSRRRISGSSPKPTFSVPRRSLTPSCARARPSAATASSIVPYVSVRRSSLRTRGPPNRRPVVPSSPRRVATAESKGASRSWSFTDGAAASPNQAGVARVPALRQQGHLDVVLDDRLRLVLDLLDHRPGVGAERGRQDHLDLSRVRAQDDLLDQRELHDVHPDLRVHDGPQRVAPGRSRARRPDRPRRTPASWLRRDRSWCRSRARSYHRSSAGPPNQVSGGGALPPRADPGAARSEAAPFARA